MRIQRLAISIVLCVLAGSSHASGSTQAITPKTGAAVSAALAGDGQLRTGVQTRVELRFVGQPDHVLSVEYRPEDGLRLHSPSQATLRTDRHGAATDAPLVEAAVDGVHYLNVFIRQGDRRRVVSIRLTAGDTARAMRKLGDPQSPLPSLVSPGEPGVSGQGDPLIILPADEP